MRRVPLWLTIVPLLLGVAVYWHFWSGWRDRFRSDLAAVLPGQAVTIGGFPYRLEADVVRPEYRYGEQNDRDRTAGTPLVSLDFKADLARVNRTPWQRDLTVVRTERPDFLLDVPGNVHDLRVVGGAATSVSSIRLGAAGIARLSTVFSALRTHIELFRAPIVADRFEVHLRETRARSNEAWSATPPQQAQVVLAGTGVRFGGGAPLSFDLDAGITAASRLRSFAGWAAGGTVEIHDATLADRSGEIARLTGSAVADHGTLRLAGTVTTACPRTLAAALAGTTPPVESRLRNPVRLAFGGSPGAFTLAAPGPNAPSAIRGQLPPCPRVS